MILSENILSVLRKAEAEIENLTTERDAARAEIARLTAERDAAWAAGAEAMEAENARLRQEIDRLRNSGDSPMKSKVIE